MNSMIVIINGVEHEITDPAAIARIQAELPKPHDGWKPKEDEMYYYVETDGTVDSYTWQNGVGDEALLARGNCFPYTEEGKKEAERYSLRIESMRHGPMPNGGEKVWIASPWDNVQPYRVQFISSEYAYEHYLGRVHTTEPAALEWQKKYGAAWTE